MFRVILKRNQGTMFRTPNVTKKVAGMKHFTLTGGRFKFSK